MATILSSERISWGLKLSVTIDIFEDREAFSSSSVITVPQLLRNSELIFYPPALSFIKLRRLPVDKLTQNLVTVVF